MNFHMNRSVLSDQNKISGFLSGGGEMGALIGAYNWSATPLGPVEDWPQSLRTTVSLCLHSACPMALLWGPEFLMLYNDAYRFLADGKHPQSLGARVQDVWPEAWPIIGPMLQGVINEGKATWSEDRLLLLNRYGFAGESYCTLSCLPVHVEDGGVGGVLCIVNETFSAKELLVSMNANIKVAGSRLYASQQMQNLFMNTPFPVVVLSGPELRFSMVNDAFKAIIFHREVLGKTMADVFPQTGKDFLQSVENVFNTGTPFIGHEFKLMLEDEHAVQREKYFDFAFSPMYELNGEIISVIGIGTDCTEKVKAREKLLENEERLQQEVEQRTLDLKKTNEALARSNRDLEQYAFVTSHDLQEPLRKIQTFANQLYRLHKDRFDEKSHLYFSKMMSASKRMSTLINDLLYFSRLAHDEKFVLTNLNHILEDVVNDFELLIEQKDATIQSEPLPVIEAIPFQMNQLFSNLLSNALKFTNPERKPQIYIASSVATPEELAGAGLLPSGKTWYKILFRDNGIGFHPRYSEKIFEVFQRLHDRGSYEGTGMGLAMCSRIVSNHHGVIYAHGEEGQGAAFYLLLPDKPLP